VVVAAALLCGAAVLLWGRLASADGIADGADPLARLAGGLRRVPWAALPALVALSALHYVAAALCLRAAAGLRGRLPETVLVQLAAAASNRITPAGLGGAAVNVRYIVRRGHSAPSAVGVLTAIGALGAVADTVLLLAVWLVDRGRGTVPGGAAQLIGGRIAAALRIPPLSTPVLVALSALAVAVAGVVLGVAGRVGRLRERLLRLVAAVREGAHAVLALRARPAALTLLLTTSAGTTLVMGVAFLVCVHATPGPRTAAGAGTVLLLFLVGSAASSTVPMPAGIGSTEAALVGALLVTGDPVRHALATVLLFRAVTFWAPAPFGVVAARWLRRRRLL
jgi:uncharacterized membrane protein YbhN (UPF0104 family)